MRTARDAVNNGASDWGVRVWDVEKGVAITDFIRFDQGIDALALSPDGRQIAAAGFDGQVRVYDAASGKLAASFVPVPVTRTLASR